MLLGRFLIALCLALAPTGASAFSFGTFAPGETILSMELSASLAGPLSVVYDDTSGALTFTAAVSTITTDMGVYNINIGDVLFDSQVMLSSETVIAPGAFTSGVILANFTNGVVADFTITDAADSNNTLLAAEYDAGIDLQITTPGGPSFPLAGTLGSNFTVITGVGDSAFEAAWGSGGSYAAVLANFLSGGSPVGTNLCQLIEPACFTGASLDDFETNPTATLIPLATPEPGFGLLLLLGLPALRRRISRS
jgi:MYXO-CTERM domain-containing protein